MATYSDLRTSLRNLVGVTTTDADLTVSVMNSLLHEAQIEMVRSALGVQIIPMNLRSDTNVDMFANTVNYHLPSNFYQPISIKCKDSAGYWNKLEAASQEDLDVNEDKSWETRGTSDRPQFYYYDGMQTNTSSNSYGQILIGLWPAPNYASTAGLKIRYIMNPQTVADQGANSSSGIISIPAQFHHDLPYHAAWRFLHGQRENPRKDYDKYYQMFQAATQRYITMMGEQNQPDYNPRMGLLMAQRQRDYWSAY